MKDRSGIEGFARTDVHKAVGQPIALDVQAARRLPGEDLDSQYAEDAEHWAAVYGELETFIEQVLAQVPEARADTPSSPGAEYLEDRGALLSELERMRAHRTHWEQRRRVA